MGDWKLKHRRENEFTYQESSKGPAYRLEWLIDGRGQYREVTDLGRTNAWAAFVNAVWIVTGRRCTIEEPKSVTVGFLLEKTAKLEKRQTNRAFTSYLKQFDPGNFFTVEMYGQFMNEKHLPLPQTYP